MLSTGTINVPSACLRCQLRQAISCTGRRVSSTRVNHEWRTSRQFSASNQRCQNANFEGIEPHIGSHERRKLSEYPLGRIYGKPGRRHRETSARLSQDSMQKPFEVVVLRDVPDGKEPVREETSDSNDIVKTTKVDASQIARDVLDRGIGPTEAEVFESINELRPPTTIVGNEEYKELVKSLVEGYSMRQLSRYLSQTLRRLSKKNSSQAGVDTSKRRKNPISLTAWRPQSLPSDSTNIDIATTKNDEVHHNKSKLVEQVLRQCWAICNDRDVHQVGYLEMKLEPWQLSFLFDLYEDAKPMHKNWINSPLLQRSSVLRPDRANNVLHIIARKFDAEEIAEQIQKKFREFKSLELDLTALKPLDSPQRRSKPPSLPNADALELIQRRLFCMFEHRDSKTLLIHAPVEKTLSHARRAFLSLIDLPSPSSVETTTLLGESFDFALTGESSNLHLSPELPFSGVRAPESNKHRGRLASSTTLATQGSHGGNRMSEQIGTDDSLPYHQAKEVTDRLLAITPTKFPAPESSPNNTSFWELEDTRRGDSWEVQFCRFLHPNIKSNQANKNLAAEPQRSNGIFAFLNDTSRRSIIQSQVPGVANLLQRCTPLSDALKPPLIVAHFVPHPFTRHGLLPLVKLPRIRLSYHLFTNNGRLDVPKANVHEIHAVLNEQELRVQLPQEVTDLRFVRQATLRGLGGLSFGDQQIREFTAVLQRSLYTKGSFLNGTPMVKFRLPRSLFDGSKDRWVEELRQSNFELEYMFERFEQVQSLDLKFDADESSSQGTDPWLREIMGDTPSDMYLRYQEIEAGIVGGRRTELRLMYPKISALAREGVDSKTSGVGNNDNEYDAEIRKAHFRWISASLRLASAMTQINAG